MAVRGRAHERRPARVVLRVDVEQVAALGEHLHRVDVAELRRVVQRGEALAARARRVAPALDVLARHARLVAPDRLAQPRAVLERGRVHARVEEQELLRVDLARVVEVGARPRRLDVLLVRVAVELELEVLEHRLHLGLVDPPRAVLVVRREHAARVRLLLGRDVRLGLLLAEHDAEVVRDHLQRLDDLVQLVILDRVLRLLRGLRHRGTTRTQRCAEIACATRISNCSCGVAARDPVHRDAPVAPRADLGEGRRVPRAASRGGGADRRAVVRAAARGDLHLARRRRSLLRRRWSGSAPVGHESRADARGRNSASRPSAAVDAVGVAHECGQLGGVDRRRRRRGGVGAPPGALHIRSVVRQVPDELGTDGLLRQHAGLRRARFLQAATVTPSCSLAILSSPNKPPGYLEGAQAAAVPVCARAD